MQVPVHLAPPQKLLVGAQIGDAAGLHHHDPIGQGQRGQPVRDEHRRAVAGELFEHFVNQLLALEVDLAGGLVEDQNGRVAQDGPRNAIRCRWPPDSRPPP